MLSTAVLFQTIIAIYFTDILPVKAHSHVECTKLVNGECQGYARYYDYNKRDYLNTPESRDRNNIVAAGTRTCPQMPLAGEKPYTDRFPMAQVRPGDSVQIQWPPRGHAAQPHSPVWIYCSWKPTDKDSQLKLEDYVELAELPYATNCKGSDISWAVCTGSVQIPQNFTAGIHTCQWVWELNGGQTYVDCFEWDVKNEIVGNVTTTDLPKIQKIESSNEKEQLGSPDMAHLCAHIRDICSSSVGQDDARIRSNCDHLKSSGYCQ